MLYRTSIVPHKKPWRRTKWMTKEKRNVNNETMWKNILISEDIFLQLSRVLLHSLQCECAAVDRSGDRFFRDVSVAFGSDRLPHPHTPFLSLLAASYCAIMFLSCMTFAAKLLFLLSRYSLRYHHMQLCDSSSSSSSIKSFNYTVIIYINTTE